MDNEVLIAIIGATSVVSSAIAAGVFKLLELKKKRDIKISDEEPLTQIKLFENELFNKSEYWINYTIKRLGFEQGDRNWIYETIMHCKIKSTAMMCKTFIENNDLTSLTNIRFENLIFTLMSDIVDEYNDLILEEFEKYFGKNKGKKIFDLVMNKEPTKSSQSMGFNVWHSPSITYMEKSIKEHCDSFYPNNVEKMDVILDIFKCTIYSAHTHLFKTFGNFNGELDYLLLT